ncbi:MAG: hypothetical protein ACOYMA_22775, partial [Bacteroidia bacterium]
MQITQIIATVLSSMAAVLSIPISLKFKWPEPALWIIKLLASALSPLLFFIGVLSAIVGLTTGFVVVSLIGIYVAVFYFIHIYRITFSPFVSRGFEKAFGLNWEVKIGAKQKKHFLSKR